MHLKDGQLFRIEWPMVLVISAFLRADDKVRELELKTTNQPNRRTSLRPLFHIILLLPGEDKSNKLIDSGPRGPGRGFF